MNTPEKKHLVCAIYTRKSTSEGLDQDFTSLDNQRESAENFIKSQQHEGWSASQELYDDGGFTGANIERPALQKLLTHIKEGTINCVVVYKVDRLSRSLLDFAQLLEFFDKNKVTFVSVTQQFNTNTSMGRLTLNILLSFAQFEREIISERTRDKMGAARKRGQWLGGRPPYGYTYDPTNSKKIAIDPATSPIIERIFLLYLEKNSALEVSQTLNAEGLRTSSWTTKGGRTLGGKKYSLWRITYVLRNPAYIGKVKYNGQIYQGLWPALIDEETFNKVQEKLKTNRHDRKTLKNSKCGGLLSQILKCNHCGGAMVHTYVLKEGRHKYRYYICSNAQKRGKTECSIRYVNAPSLEENFEQALRAAINASENIPNSSEKDALFSPIWTSLFFEEKQRIVRSLVKLSTFDSQTNKISITLEGTHQSLEFNGHIERIHAPTRDGKKKRLAKEPVIRKMLLLAHQLGDHIEQGKIPDLNQAAAWTGISQARLNHIITLLNLSPVIQTEIITDPSPILHSIPEYKLRSISNETDWPKQSAQWQELKTSASIS